MNRTELIDALADKTGSSKADAGRNIAALLDIISVSYTHLTLPTIYSV